MRTSPRHGRASPGTESAHFDEGLSPRASAASAAVPGLPARGIGRPPSGGHDLVRMIKSQKLREFLGS